MVVKDYSRQVKSMDGFEELTLELTDWCSAECVHCSSSSNPKCGNYLEEKLALRLVKEAAFLGAKKVSFGGGEPVAARSFMCVIQHVIELGMCAEVFTCGLVGDDENMRSLPDEILSNCKDLPRLKFIFSFHGATAQVHDYVTKTPRTFDLLMKSVHKSLCAGINSEINFVPMRVNVHEFGELVDLAEGLGIQRISVLRFVPQGRGLVNRSEIELSSEEEALFVEELLRLRSERNVDIRTGSPFNGIVPGNQVPCRAGFGKLVVQADGNVLPCEVFKHHKRCQLGLSVHNMTLSQILESPQVSDLHDRLQYTQCLECPIHRILRKTKKAEVSHVLSETTVQAK